MKVAVKLLGSAALVAPALCFPFAIPEHTAITDEIKIELPIVAEAAQEEAGENASSTATIASTSSSLSKPQPQRETAPQIHAVLSAATRIAAPAKLVIPKIKVNARIVAEGLEEDGRMAIPDNFTEVGWYSDSAMPGMVGNAVMGAHVDDGHLIHGVFKRLRDLAPGDTIYVYDVSGTKRHFTVTKRAILNKDMRDTTSVFTGEGGTRGLVLITCHGAWLPGENTYSARLVVFAELVK